MLFKINFLLTEIIDIMNPGKSKGVRTLNQSSNLSTGEVLCYLSHFFEVYILEDFVSPGFLCMDFKNVESSLFVWEADFNLDFESSSTKDGTVEEIPSVGHADNEDVVEGVYTVDHR